VLDAANAAAALQIGGDGHRSIDLLVNRCRDAGIGWPRFANRMLVLHPKVKVLYMSGSPTIHRSTAHARTWNRELLEKPFTLHALFEQGCKVLHGAEEVMRPPPLRVSKLTTSGMNSHSGESGKQGDGQLVHGRHESIGKPARECLSKP